MTKFDMVNVMAGQGRRFRDAGFSKPRALLRLHGKPVFWWATESVRCCFDVGQMVFVIQQSDVDRFGMDRVILLHYPDARLVILREVTPGPVASAVAGCSLLPPGRGLLVNECTQVFSAGQNGEPQTAGVDGFVCTFDGSARQLARGVAGLYGFCNRGTFLDYARSGATSPDEPTATLQSIFQMMRASGRVVGEVDLGDYIPLVTPGDYDAAPNQLKSIGSRQRSVAEAA